MIKIIDGKRYNTETAEEIASDSSGYPVNDFRYCKEVLYKTKKGQWFIYGDGGAMSKYSKTVGDSTCGDTQIVPITEQEAFKFLEKSENYEELEQYFGSDIEEA